MIKKALMTTAIAGMCTSAYAQDYFSDSSEYVPLGAQNREQVFNYTGNPSSAGAQERAWDLSLILGLKREAKYSGADKRNNQVVFGANGEYRLTPFQRLFLSTDTGIGWGYSFTPNFEAGGGIGYREGRTNSRPILNGMEEVEDTATAMAFANWKISKCDLGIKLEKGIDDANEGTTTEFSAGYKNNLTPNLVWGTKLATIYGSGTYMEQNYGVLPADAIPGRPAYQADGGFSEASIKLFGNYVIAGPHSLLASATYTALLSDAKDSPIVESDDDIAVFFGYSYKF